MGPESNKFNRNPIYKGLYRPEFEHDACGVGVVADIKGRSSHDIVLKGLQVLLYLAHRGAKGSDPGTGDGAGIMIQMPDDFMRREAAEKLETDLPPQGSYGVGMIFLPSKEGQAEQCIKVLDMFSPKSHLA